MGDSQVKIGMLDIRDRIGGMVDDLFLMLPKMIRPFIPLPDMDRKLYERQIDFYFDAGYVDSPVDFFRLPEAVPEARVVSSTPFLSGKREVYAFDSGYEPANPLVADRFSAFSENRTAYLVKWSHGEEGRKTVLCLHGYMLGDPDQAEKMFNVARLHQMGLDVALFISPFHWRRAPESKVHRGIFLQPNDVVMTCECFGQAMHDLYRSMRFLRSRGAADIGIIGASLGGYNAGLIAALTDAAFFSALMVPAVQFTGGNFTPEAVRHPFPIEAEFMDRIMQVWTLHSPLNFMPKISKERILVIASKGDQLCPFEHVLALCRKWGWPPHLFMTGGHWLMFDAKARGRMWYRFLSDMGFVSEAP